MRLDTPCLQLPPPTGAYRSNFSSRYRQVIAETEQETSIVATEGFYPHR
jgi:hypothetical protein